MQAFTKVRIYPSHGTRSAAITWEMSPHAPAGDVYIARSDTGADGTWLVLNTAPVVSSLGLFTDTALDVNSGSAEVYYKLLLVSVGHEDMFSQPFSINTLLSPQEQGIARGILHRLYQIMRSRNGYPVWWCIPKTSGELSPLVDPDTGEMAGIECPGTPADQATYEQQYIGGFHAPILTWIMPKQTKRFTKTDAENGLYVKEEDEIEAMVLAWPVPSRGHMVVEPVTDRRYLVQDEIKPNMLRGIYPLTFDITLEFLPQGDARQRLVMPDFDIRTYRRL